MLGELQKYISIPIFVVAVFVGIVSSLSTIALMGLSGWLIASAALLTPLYMLSLAILGVRVFGILRPIFRYLDRFFTHKLAFEMFARWRTTVVSDIIQVLPLNFSNKENTYEIIANAVDKIRDAWIRFYLHPFCITGATIFLFVFIYFYSTSIALLLIFSYIILVWIYPSIALYYYRNNIIKSLEIEKDIVDIYDGNAELISYNYVKSKLEKVKLSIEQYQTLRAYRLKLKARLSAISDILFGVFMVMTLIILIIITNNHEITAVVSIMLLLLLQSIYENMMMTVDIVEQFDEASKNWHRLSTALKSNFRLNSNLGFFENNLINHGQLDVVNLSYGYDFPIVTDISFSLNKGRRTLILGESGSGKSTLFNVLTKIMNPLSGSIYFLGENFEKLDVEYIREHIAVCFQDQHIFNATIRENFQILYHDISDDEITNILTKLNLISIFDKGLSTQLINSGMNLSGGQRHRLQIAMSLARQKDIILLDEPTAGLDTINTKNLLNNMDNIFGNSAVLVATHDLSLLDYFDDIIILSNNKMVESGKISDLLTRKNTYLNKLLKYRNCN